MTEIADASATSPQKNMAIFAAGCLILGLLVGGAIARAIWGTPARLSSDATQLLPDGWRNLDAPEFLLAAEKIFNKPEPPPVDHQWEIMEFAWTQFLSDPQFVEQADWKTLQRAIRLLPHRRVQVRDSGGTVAEELAADQRLSDDIGAFRARILERIGTDTRILVGDSYLDLIRLSAALERLGSSGDERRRVFLNWMARNDWQQLDLIELGDLLENIVVAKAPVRAARWTGSITAPSTARYTFSQLRQYRGDPVLKLKIDNAVVLHSTPTGTGPDGGSSERFRSQPILLTAGKPVAIEVELVLDDNQLKYLREPDVQFGLGLMWEAEGMESQLVPEAVFSPPQGFSGKRGTGLKGEYFSDVKFQNLLHARLDPALDMFWVGVPVPKHASECQSVRNACLAKAQIAGAIDALKSKELSLFAGNSLWRVAGEMRLPDRREFVRGLARKRNVLEATDEFAMGRLLRTIYFLPEKDHLPLLQAWAEARPQPRLRLDPIPGSRSGNYYISNFPRLYAVGQYFQGPYWADAERLWEKHLAGGGGECHLALAYPTGLAAHDAGEEMRKKYLGRIESALSSKSLSGDARATWLMARALAKETFVSGPVRPALGLDDLESAVAVASTNDGRFWALEELVVRLGALGYSQRTNGALDQFQSSFSAPSQQAKMARWRKEVNYLEALYAARQAEREIEPIHSYIAEMESRLATASEKKDKAAIARFQKMIESANLRLNRAKEAVGPKMQSLKEAEAVLTGQTLPKKQQDTKI